MWLGTSAGKKKSGKCGGPSPQDLEAEARYVLSIISPWCISHCHMALSLIFEVEQIITQLAIGKMWRYHILPIQIL